MSNGDHSSDGDHSPDDPYESLEEPEGTDWLDKVAKQHQQETEQFAHQIETVTRSLGTAVSSVEFHFERAALDRIVTDRAQNQRISIGRDTPNQPFDRTEKRMTRLLSGLDAAGKVRLRAEFMAEMFGIVSDGDARRYDRLLTLLVATAEGREIAETEGLTEDLTKLLNTWQSRDAGKIWADLAARHPKGLADASALTKEMGSIALVGELAPKDYIWLWQDRAEIVKHLRSILSDRELAFPIDAAAIYDRIAKLQHELKLPLAVAAELAGYAFGAAGMEHGLSDPPGLEYNKLLRRDSIARVDRIGDKLVFVVTGLAGEKLVLKCEMPLVFGAVDPLSQRFDLTRDVARLCLDRLPAVERLAESELRELLNLEADVEGADEFVKMLVSKEGAPGLKDLSLILKMEHVDVGESLISMRDNGTVPKDLLSLSTLQDLGKMAMFDLLMGNEDRFHEYAKGAKDNNTYLNMENVDFRLTDGGKLELVPLDNMTPKDLLSKGIDAFMTREFLAIGNHEARQTYARDVVLWLCGELKIMPQMREIPGMQAEFLEGMMKTLTAMRDYMGQVEWGEEFQRSALLRELIKRIKAIG